MYRNPRRFFIPQASRGQSFAGAQTFTGKGLCYGCKSIAFCEKKAGERVASILLLPTFSDRPME
jgi:hypothetical protein